MSHAKKRCFCNYQRNINKVVFTGISLLGLFLAGCGATPVASSSETPWTHPCSPLYDNLPGVPAISQGEIKRPPKTLIASFSQGGTTTMVFDEAKGEYVLGESFDLPRHIRGRIAFLNGKFYVAIEGGGFHDEKPDETALDILEIDFETLKLERRVRIPADPERYNNQYLNKGTITTDGQHLYLSGQGDFIILDGNLKELGRVELFVTDEMKKNAHDIMVEDKIAYLLDNVVRPIYTFRVDVTDPTNPKIIEKHKSHGINEHLDWQFTVQSPPLWVYKSSSDTQGGHAEWFNQKCLAKADSPVTGGRCISSQEFSVDVVTPTEVPLAFIHDEENHSSYLGRGTYDDKYGFHFERLVELGQHLRFYDAMYQDGYVYGIFSSQPETESRFYPENLMVIDVSGEKPLLVLRQNLLDASGLFKSDNDEGRVLYGIDEIILATEQTGILDNYPLVSLTGAERKITACTAPRPTLQPPSTPEKGWWCEMPENEFEAEFFVHECHQTHRACRKELKGSVSDTCEKRTTGACTRIVGRYGERFECFESKAACENEWDDMYLYEQFSKCVDVSEDPNKN